MPSIKNKREWQQIRDTVVTFAKAPFVNETEDTDVATEAQGRKIAVQKSRLLAETNVMAKMSLRIINLTHKTATGVKDRRMLIFN